MTTYQDETEIEVPRTNGHQKGRKVPELPTYTFAVTGVEVKIRRLGPFTMDEIRKSLKKQRKPPEVPTVVVEVGDARVRLSEPNPGDPDYRRAVEEYNLWISTTIGEKMMDLMVNYCILCTVEEDIVTEKRALLAMIDPTINEEYSDREVYVQHYLLGTTDELESVQNFILGRSMPTEEAVQEHIDTFPGDVQGETPVRSPGTPIGL